MVSRAALTRSAVTIGSQSLSSVTNFAVGALAVAAGSIEAFGRFAIVYQLCLVVIALGQGAIGTTMLIHTSDPGERTDSMRRGTAAAGLVIGGAVGLVLVVAGLLVGGAMQVPLVLAGLGSPALVAQYAYRDMLFARGRAGAALAADAVWLAVLVVVALADAVGAWDPSANGYLAAWLVGAAVSGAPMIGAGLRASGRDLAAFVRTAGPQSLRQGIDSMLARSVFVVTLIAARLVVDAEASGALAAAVLAFSPMSVVQASVPAVVVPGEVRARGIHVVRRSVPLLVMAGTTAITLVWAALLWLFDRSGAAFGPFALADNLVTTSLFLATLLRFVALSLQRGPSVALRIADAAAESLEARIVGTVAQWVVPVVGLILWELDGGAWGLGVASLFGAGVTWQRYASLRRPATGG